MIGIAAVLVLAMGLATPAMAAASVADLAVEFRLLRQQQGHFSGGAWNDDVDRWDGRKHRVMVALGEALGDGKHSRAEILAMMGEPDHVLKPGQRMFGIAYDGNDPRVRELLVYQWRGMRDFLFFTSDGKRVFAADWWMALE